MSFKSGNISFYESTFKILINNGRKYIGLFRRVNNLQTFQSYKQGNYQFLGFFALKLFTYFPLAHINTLNILFLFAILFMCVSIPTKPIECAEDPCFSVNDDVCAILELAVQCQVFRQSRHVS